MLASTQYHSHLAWVDANINTWNGIQWFQSVDADALDSAVTEFWPWVSK